MQRKKLPVLLISILAIAVAVIMFANSSFATASSEDHSHDEQQMHDEPTPDKVDPAETKRQMAESLKGKASPERPSMTPAMPAGGGENSAPSIQTNNGARNKPRPPDDISTAGQWYTKESGAKK